LGGNKDLVRIRPDGVFSWLKPNTQEGRKLIINIAPSSVLLLNKCRQERDFLCL